VSVDRPGARGSTSREARAKNNLNGALGHFL